MSDATGPEPHPRGRATARRTELDELSTAFMTASRALVGISLRSIQAAPIEITAVQHRALVLLAGHGDMAVGVLAEELGVNPSNASRVCDRLQRLGLVTRVRSPRDGRAVCVHLTPAGTAVLDAVTEHRRQEIERVLSSMTRPDARTALRAMQAFAEAAHERVVDGSPVAGGAH